MEPKPGSGARSCQNPSALTVGGKLLWIVDPNTPPQGCAAIGAAAAGDGSRVWSWLEPLGGCQCKSTTPSDC